MNTSDFDLYKKLLQEKSGLTLSPDKAYLLESRLTPVAKKWNHSSLEDLTKALRRLPDKAMVIDIVEAMTTNETSFFRDGRPFEIFKNMVLPYFLKNRVSGRNIKIWCAAASSGQELYSLAMTIKENESLLSGWNFEITGTDISMDILEQAKKGVYSQFEVQRGLPIQLLMKYFDQVNESWQIKDEIRKMITFKPFNLLDSMGGLGTFDIIFCRNVLIYFDEETKTSVLKRMAERLTKDGFLFLGGAETVLGISDAFKPMEGQRGLYILQNGTYNFGDETVPNRAVG